MQPLFSFRTPFDVPTSTSPASPKTPIVLEGKAQTISLKGSSVGPFEGIFKGLGRTSRKGFIENILGSLMEPDLLNKMFFFFFLLC